MTLDDFVFKWTGKPVDFDGIYPNQCMDLMHQYVYDVLGLTDRKILSHPAAYQVFTEFTEDQYFEKIANSPTGVPQPGDIVLFNKTSSNPYGHVCIFLSGDANKFKSFDANYPTGSLPHVQDHTYGYCLGWLRFKKKEDTQTIINELREARDNNDRLYKAQLAKNEELEKTLQNINIELNGTTAELQAFRGIIRHYATLLNCKESETEKMAGEIKRLIDIETIYQASESTIKNLNTEVEGLKANEVRLENDLTEIAKQKNDVEAELAICRKDKTSEGLAYYTWFTRFWSLFRIFFTRKRV